MKRLLFPAILTAFLLCACSPGAPRPAASPAPPAPSTAVYDGSSARIDWSDYTGVGKGSIAIDGVVYETLGAYAVEHESDLAIAQTTLAQIGNYFIEEYPALRERYALLEGTPYEMAVESIQGEKSGPSIYIVSGIHGDERAGWYAGALLKQATLRAGTLYVIAPANVIGARALTRSVDGEDLNRSFPGDPTGSGALRIADAIYRDIARVSPALVLDLHEARAVVPGRDFLGSTVIYTPLDGIDELFFSMMAAIEAGDLCSERFGYTGPGPIGSVNSSVSIGLNIPVLTVETFRAYDITRRVGDQLAIAEFVLEFYGMC